MNDVFLPHPSSHDKKGYSKIIPRPLHWLRRSPSRSAMFKCICHCTRLIRTFPFSEGKDLKPGRPGLYSQTSARPYGVARDCLRNRKVTSLTIGCARQSIQASLMLCSRWHEKVNFVDSRLRSAEHSSELNALLSLAREL